MLKRINESLPGLIVGILLYGVVVQLAGVWFVEDKWEYSIGLWYGIGLAMGMAIHMAVVIYDAITLDGEETAKIRIASKATLRHVVLVILVGVFVYFHLGNFVTAFLGLMGLKVSAYLQPLLTKAINKVTGRVDASSIDEDNENKIEEVTM